MKGAFFPEHYARVNANESRYATIAFRAYCDAKNTFSALSKDTDRFIDSDETYIIDECVAICDTFSAFAIESYLNTYAATCFGDDIFYGNFEKLSALSKLQLIAQFLYNEPVEKGGELYYLIKNLFSSRDSYAHSKSQSISGKYGSSEIDLEVYERQTVEQLNEEYNDALKNIMARYQGEINRAELSIKAIAALLCFIDAHDRTAYALYNLLPFANEEKTIIGTTIERIAKGHEELPKEYREDMRRKAISLVKHYSCSFSFEMN